MSDGSDSLHDDMDSSADGLDNTPRDEVRDGPLPEGHPGFRPAGPPPPRPVCGPDPNDNQPRREEDGVENHDNRSAAAPARHTPARRPPPPESSSSSSSDTDDADPDPETAEEEHAHDDDGWWSDTSIILEGAELDEARDYFVNQFRRQLRESQPDLSNRSVLVKLARYGAAWHSLPGLKYKDWRHSVSWAPSCVNGLPLSTGPLTSTTLDEQWLLSRDRQGRFPVGRPRSLCNKYFQALVAIHPHSPEFRPLFKRQRQTRRRVCHLTYGAADRQPSRCTAGRPVYTSRVKLLPKPPLLKPRHKTLPNTPTANKTLALCHNCCSRPQNRLAPRCSGPKSGDHGNSFRPLKLVAFYAMVGVRVSSAAATEEGPTTGLIWSVGKPSGLAQRGGEQTSITKSSKRAFNRACKRANQALDGGTWYKGRWHTRQALASLRQSAPTPVLRQTPPMRPRRIRARPLPNLSLFVWNTGGLASGMLQEFMAWCETQTQYDMILLLETHWRETPDYRSGKWHCIHTSGHSVPEQPDRFAGILCLISDRTFTIPSVKEVVPGRLLHVQAQHLARRNLFCISASFFYKWVAKLVLW